MYLIIFPELVQSFGNNLYSVSPGPREFCWVQTMKFPLNEPTRDWCCRAPQRQAIWRNICYLFAACILFHFILEECFVFSVIFSPYHKLVQTGKSVSVVHQRNTRVLMGTIRSDPRNGPNHCNIIQQPSE